MSSDNSVRIHDDSEINSIKNTARDIRESSGAFQEIARATLETTIAIRDIANEVNETVKDLNERGTIKDIASAVVETTNATRNTIGIAKAAIVTDNTKRGAF